VVIGNPDPNPPGRRAAAQPAPQRRYLGGLALTFTGIHLTALLLDSHIQFNLVDLLVPFAAGWRPGTVAWGVVALYLAHGHSGRHHLPGPVPAAAPARSQPTHCLPWSTASHHADRPHPWLATATSCLRRPTRPS
jgi:hypothetical protein